jgi:hypothetical protein
MNATHQASRNGPSNLDAISDAVANHLEPEEAAAVARERATRAAEPFDSLRRVRALAELLEIDEARAVLRAADAGQTQRAIAEALGKPQTQIHRILRRARLSETDMRTSAREVILQCQAGAITHGMMVGLLKGAAEGKSAQGEHDSGFAPDDWDEIRSAYMSSLLTEAEYEELRRSSRQAGNRRRR